MLSSDKGGLGVGLRVASELALAFADDALIAGMIAIDFFAFAGFFATAFLAAAFFVVAFFAMILSLLCFTLSSFYR
jgi:hypothetical protein